MNQTELWMQTPIPTARAAYPGYDPDAPLPPAPEAGEPVLDITDCHPRIAYAASYLHMGVPGALTRCYVRKGVYERLCRALDLLPEAYSLRIYDSLRPQRVQQALYDDYFARVKAEHPGISDEQAACLTEEFVARPVLDRLHPSSHQSGGAVDLTLCLEGRELDMGTGFDEFAPIAHADAFEREGLDETVRRNRRLLHHAMRQAGFTHYSAEWWHFDYGNGPWARRTHSAPLYAFCAEGDLR